MKLFTLAEFEEKIKKEYSWTKKESYIFAIINGIISLGLIFLFFETLKKEVYEATFLILIVALYAGYISIIGIIRIPKIPKIYQIYSGGDFDTNVQKMFSITKKLKLKEGTYDKNIYTYYSRNIWLSNREILFFINEEGVWINIQWTDSKYNYINRDNLIKLKDKIQSEFEQTKKTS